VKYLLLSQLNVTSPIIFPSRDLKSARSNPAKRGRGNAALKQLATREEKQRAGKKRSPQSNSDQQRGGRGQGGRGINKDGKGGNKNGKEVSKGSRPNTQGSHNRRVSNSTTGGGKAAHDKLPNMDPRPVVSKPSDYSPKPLPSVPRPIPVSVVLVECGWVEFHSLLLLISLIHLG